MQYKLYHYEFNNRLKTNEHNKRLVMKKFLPFSRRQPSLDRYSINRGWSNTDKCNAKSMRRISATSLNTKSIQVVRGAYNIDLNKVDSSFTKLHRACLLNDDNQVKKQIHKVDNNSHDSSHRYPIHLATVNGNFEIVKLLIENQANPNVQDNEGNTPLIKSIECGHEHLVKYLLNNNADPNICDLENNSALHWAFMTESMIAIEALLNSNKCDYSLRNNKYETPLHLAVRSPLVSASSYKVLVNSGCDLNATDQLGLTVGEIAQACNNQVAISVLTSNSTANKTKSNGDIDVVDDTNKKQSEEPLDQMKICEEYKMQYITKNQENLEYEKRLIQLNAQIERLKLDMSFMREQNEKLEEDFERLSRENSKLKIDNENLLKQIHESKQKEAENNDLKESAVVTKNDDRKGPDLGAECIGQEQFLKTRRDLQRRIDELKLELTTN